MLPSCAWPACAVAHPPSLVQGEFRVVLEQSTRVRPALGRRQGVRRCRGSATAMDQGGACRCDAACCARAACAVPYPSSLAGRVCRVVVEQAARARPALRRRQGVRRCWGSASAMDQGGCLQM